MYNCLFFLFLPEPSLSRFAAPKELQIWRPIERNSSAPSACEAHRHELRPLGTARTEKFRSMHDNINVSQHTSKPLAYLSYPQFL